MNAGVSGASVACKKVSRSSRRDRSEIACISGRQFITLSGAPDKEASYWLEHLVPEKCFEKRLDLVVGMYVILLASQKGTS